MSRRLHFRKQVRCERITGRKYKFCAGGEGGWVTCYANDGGVNDFVNLRTGEWRADVPFTLRIESGPFILEQFNRRVVEDLCTLRFPFLNREREPYLWDRVLQRWAGKHAADAEYLIDRLEGK